MSQDKIWAYYQTKTPEIFRGSGFRLNYLTRYLHPDQRALNVGIGSGILERCARRKGVDIFSLDPDWTSLCSHVEESPSRLIAGRLEDMPFADNTFDAVIISEILEHLTPEEMRKALQEIRRVLVPGGEIIGTVPCEENLADSIVVCPKCGEVFHKVGHQQSFDTKRVASVLRPVFTDPKCFERAFMAKASVGWKELIIDIMRNFLVRTGVLTRETHVVFRARKTF